MHNLNEIQIITFPMFDSRESFLVVFESEKQIPFKIERIFTVKSIETSTRGFHAHKECSQLLIVLNGECKITCDDGSEKKEYILNQPSKGLLIPPTIWAEQEYQPNTILMVITDRAYEESDYLRNYQEFIDFRLKL